MSRVYFQSVDGAPLRHWLFFGRQRVFRNVMGQFPDGGGCSAASLVVFRLKECVPQCPGPSPAIPGLTYFNGSSLNTVILWRHRLFVRSLEDLKG